MLCVARLLLIGSVAAAISVIAIIASGASSFSPFLFIFAAAAVLFALAGGWGCSRGSAPAT